MINSIAIFILSVITIIPATLVAIFNKQKGYKILIAIDQLWAVIIFDREDITISSLLWHNYHNRGKLHYKKYVAIVDTLAFIIARQKNHCKTSYQNEVIEFNNYVKTYKKNI